MSKELCVTNVDGNRGTVNITANNVIISVDIEDIEKLVKLLENCLQAFSDISLHSSK